MRFTYAEAMIDPTTTCPSPKPAEAAGFDGFLVPDSICYPAGVGRRPTRTRRTATAASSRTSRSSSRSRSSPPWAPSPSGIRFVISVLKLTVRHPVLVAKQAASTAVLTATGSTLGVGTSPWPEDYEVCDVPFERAGQARRREHRRDAGAARPATGSSTTARSTTSRASSSARCPPRRSRSSSAATPSRRCGAPPATTAGSTAAVTRALPGLIARLHELRAEERAGERPVRGARDLDGRLHARRHPPAGGARRHRRDRRLPVALRHGAGHRGRCRPRSTTCSRYADTFSMF